MLVGRPQDLESPVWNGFRPRVRMIRRALAQLGDVQLVGLRRQGDPDETQVAALGGSERYLELEIPKKPDDGKLSRITRLVPRSRPSDARHGWERELEASTKAFDPDLIVTLGPWLGSEFRVLNAGWPVINFFEEDLRAMPELAPQSFQAQSFRRLEDLVERQRAPSPSLVVFISEVEEQRSRWRFPRSRSTVLPFTFEPANWRVAESPSSGEALLAVGNFAEARNAEGLAAVMRSMGSRGSLDPSAVTVVSAAGVHPLLLAMLPASAPGAPAVGPSELWSLYRSANVAIVPATRATGFKTTILQAWAAGCPVVCTRAAARTMAERHQPALVIADGSSDFALLAQELFEDEPRRRDLAHRGLEIAAADFDPPTVEQTLMGLIDSVIG